MNRIQVFVASVAAVSIAVVVVLVGIVLDSFSDEHSELCDPGPKPARTPPPSERAVPVAWLGSQYSGLRFHSAIYRRPVEVNYGEPVTGESCASGGYFFAISVLTAPRRPETRRRLRRSLGPGVRTTRGTRYGCRRSESPRIALLSATIRIEVIGTTCRESIAASRSLRLASDGR